MLGVYMNVKMIKFDEIHYGWKIKFVIELNEEENSKFNMKPIKHVGSYDIKKNNNVISFDFVFDRGELLKNETIEERLELIKKDVKTLVVSCL